MPAKQLRFAVAGGYDESDPETLDRSVDQIKEFARALSQQIIEEGHSIYNGGQTDLDFIVAEAAAMKLQDSQPDEDPHQRIVSYVLQGKRPVHNFGTVIRSDLPDWNLGGPSLKPPEVIRYADVVILLGGFEGTMRAANWARIEGKPILPFAIFGGSAKEVYQEEINRFEKIYKDNIEQLDYERVLKSLHEDWTVLAKETVTIAERIVTTPAVFIIMSFTDKPEYKDLYSVIKRVCNKHDYVARRVDESNMFKRIVPEITRQIRQCAFVIADVTEPKPNVYYELGLADGLSKELVITAKKGTDLPFDINDVPVVFWESFADFETDLEKRVQQIGNWQGRD